jgi:uncharacterized sulfatase
MIDSIRGPLAAVLLIAGQTAFANELEYRLQPVEVAPGCYALIGAEDYFDTENGGDISNTGFVVTGAGVVVIDTGSSRRYGAALREVIDVVAQGQPVERVIITHAHPDHYLGNQEFLDVPIFGGPETTRLIEASGEDFTVNMYRLVGDWMRGTESVAPTHPAVTGRFELGDHRFNLYRFEGHTDEDLVLVDETCGVAYAGDLVFNARTLSTPHADLDAWIANLEKLRQAPFGIMVPGHGAIDRGDAAIAQTIDYLQWLKRRLHRAFHAGLDITEVMELPLPERFAGFSLARDEYRRSVHNLYPAIEASGLPPVEQ